MLLKASKSLVALTVLGFATCGNDNSQNNSGNDSGRFTADVSYTTNVDLTPSRLPSTICKKNRGKHGQLRKDSCSVTAGAYLAGRVSLGSNSEVEQSRVVVRDARTFAILATGRTNRDGYFLVGGIPSNTKLYVSAEGGTLNNSPLTGTLSARHIATGDDALLWITPQSTLTDRIMTKAPNLAEKEAEKMAQKALGLPQDLESHVDFRPGYLHYHPTAFDSNEFLAAARQVGGINAFLRKLTREALQKKSGQRFSLRAGSQAGQSSFGPASVPTEDMMLMSTAGIGSSITLGLASGAAGQVGGLAMGWLMSAIGIPSPTTEAIDNLSKQMQAQAQTLNEVYHEINQLFTEITQVQAEIQDLASNLTTQINALSQAISQSEYQASYETANAYAVQLQTWMERLALFISQIQDPPGGDVASVMEAAADWVNNLSITGVGPIGLQTLLLDLLYASPDSGIYSLFKQYSDVVFGPKYCVMNQKGSQLLAAKYQYWQYVMVKAEYLAMEYAHALKDKTLVDQALGTANTYIANVIAPNQLPPGVAIQLCNYDINNGIFQGGVFGNLMWATDFLPGIIIDSISPPWNIYEYPLPGAVAGPGGAPLSGWLIANGWDVLSFTTLPAATSQNSMAVFIPNLLGLSEVYAHALNTIGWFDGTQACANLTSFLPVTGHFANCSSSTVGYYYAYRIEENAAQYLPPN